MACGRIRSQAFSFGVRQLVNAVVFSIVVLLASLTPCYASAQDSTMLEVVGTTMGKIRYRVLVVCDEPTDAEKEELKSTIQSVLDRVNDLMSTYKSDSDVSEFNRIRNNDWHPVQQETAIVVQRAIEISQRTEGAFDITVGPAVKRWNFGPDKQGEGFTVPDQQAIDELKSHIGYQQLEVRVEPPAIRKQDPQIEIDLSAIAKGYAVDAVLKSLVDLGYQDSLVDVGGEASAVGERRGGGAWRVAVENPNVEDRPVDNPHAKVIQLTGASVATSGDYRNFAIHDGKRYSHTIDPRTCSPVRHGLATASIVAEDCMTADALATAVMVLGAAKGHEICAAFGCEVFTMERKGDTENFLEQVSAGYPVYQMPVPPEVVGESDHESVVVAAGDSSTRSILPTFLAAIVVFGLMILAMAVGAIFNNKPVQGSCGGLANMTNEDGEEVCGVCSKPTTDCVEQA